jgi:hypothetical protein
MGSIFTHICMVQLTYTYFVPDEKIFVLCVNVLVDSYWRCRAQLVVGHALRLGPKSRKRNSRYMYIFVCIYIQVNYGLSTMYTYMYIYMKQNSIRTYIHATILYQCLSYLVTHGMHTHAHAHIHAHAYIHAHANAHMHTCTHMHTHAHAHIYTHAQTCTHTHAHAHTHTCTHIKFKDAESFCCHLKLNFSQN